MARHTVKSPERVEAILKALRAGSTRRAAADFGENHVDTFYDWLKNDPSFSDAVVKAEADAEVRFQRKIATAAGKSWQAAAWWLERRRPDDYRASQNQILSGSLTIGLAELVREARKTKNVSRDSESTKGS